MLKTVLRLDFINRLKILHNKAFSNKFLLFTNVGISLGLSASGDVMEQHYERYCGELTCWDRTRSSNMAISGVSVGIICHYWYQYLDRRMPGRTIGVVMKKIFLDQVICSPVYISAFFITLGILERKKPDKVWEEMKQKAWKLYAAEWVLWPVAQFVNFYWLPTKYRVFYDNAISLCYDVYTSRVKHHE